MKALIPLRYCEFRISSGQDVDICATFAGELVHGLAFCEGHAELIARAMDDSGVELIPTGKITKVGG